MFFAYYERACIAQLIMRVSIVNNQTTLAMETKTAFLQIFGDSPMLKVMDFLIVNEDFDYSITDIAVHSGVGYSTLKLFWKKLEESKIVKQTRVVGKAKMYRLNFGNPAVKKFRDFYWETTKQAVHEEVKEKRSVDV